MKSKKYLLMAVENGIPDEVAESNSPTRLANRAMKEMRKLMVAFDGNVTWRVIEVETGHIWFHVGLGNPQPI